MKSHLTVMIYDVTSDRRRDRLHALLKQYGVAVQKSAFEGRLTAAERTQLARLVKNLVNAAEDRFVMYTIPPAHEQRILEVGLPRPEIRNPDWYII
ncbi:MAG: CRISPR-associated endonuclease Cas2 [Planctomycetota bacterium]